MGQSFKLMGEAATMEVFTNPAVSAGVEGFTKHLDVERLGQVLGKSETGK